MQSLKTFAAMVLAMGAAACDTREFVLPPGDPEQGHGGLHRARL